MRGAYQTARRRACAIATRKQSQLLVYCQSGSVDMIRLQSSNLEGFEYDPTTQELIVEFKDGTRYVHHGVSPEVVSGLQAAESAGSYYHQVLKNRFNVQRL